MQSISYSKELELYPCLPIQTTSLSAFSQIMFLLAYV